MTRRIDLAVVGGGIVGVATAWEFVQQNPGATVEIIEKEPALAGHQTGHNSGVIHSGIYYAPGSLKARFCREGAQATKDFAGAHGIRFEQTGKILVATNALEEERLQGLIGRAAENDIDVTPLTGAQLHEMEPNVSGVAGLLVHETGIIDYREVTAALAADATERGGRIRLSTAVRSIDETSDRVRLGLSDGDTVEATNAVFCAGLQADRVARMAGFTPPVQIVPFRGEYFQLPPHLSGLVTRLIYPVPDPDLPFLGVHVSPTIQGVLTVGPNAVLGLAREGYPKGSINLRDAAALAFSPAMWKVATSNIGSGLHEMRNSMFKSGYLREVRKYAPSITARDLLPRTAGIRAQAVSHSGDLVHDFVLHRTERSLHVLNAPSPAATSAIPIARHIIARLADASTAAV
jgi:(S)-2-hydroxyglutarate dehydrogenase